MSSANQTNPPLKAAVWCNTETPQRDVNFSYLWSIDNFRFKMENYQVGQELNSSNFKVNVEGRDTVWNLRCYPNGKEEEENGVVGLFFYLNTVDKEVRNLFVRFSLEILNASGLCVKKQTSKKNYFKKVKDGWGWPSFISKEELKSDNGTLAGDSLRIYCEMTIYGKGSELVSSGSDWTFSGSEYEEDAPLFKIEPLDLLQSGDLSDVELVCDGSSFFCHKSILATVSPVFRAAFKTNMKEKETGKMDIEGIDKDTMSDVLAYIYGGRIDKVKDKAEKLLVVAERYDLGLLKEFCEKSLVSSLNMDNCLDYLISADQHSANFLKSSVLKFMVENAKDVERKVLWQETLVNFPQLLVEFTREVLAKLPDDMDIDSDLLTF